MIEILEKIKLDKKYFNELKDASINKVEIDKSKNEILIIINNPSNISVSCFKELNDKFKSYFMDNKVFLSF